MNQGASATVLCGFSQEKLIELLKGANHDSASNAFKMYFFTNTEFAGKDVPDAFTPRADILPHVPRCLQCGHTIAEHKSATAKEYCAVTGTLVGWRTKFGVRELVTTYAQKLGARGKIEPAGPDVKVNLVFDDLKGANKFTIELREKAKLWQLESNLVKAPTTEYPPPLADYTRLQEDNNSPDRESAVTPSSVARLKASEVLQYRSVTLWTGGTQLIHLVPRALLAHNISGTWMLIAGSPEINKWTDDNIPSIDLDVKVGETKGERTIVQLLIGTTRLHSDEVAFLKRNLVPFFGESNGVFAVPIQVCTHELDLFLVAIEWRKASVAAAMKRREAGQPLHNNNRPPGSAWWLLVSLPEQLQQFARATSPRSPPKRPHSSNDDEASTSDN